MPSTPDLNAIKARVVAATPGPWEVEEFNDRMAGTTSYYLAWIERWRGHFNNVSLGEDKATAEFIAHARDDIPALIAEIERLNAAAEDARKHLREAFRWTDSGGECAGWIDDALTALG
jgi:hypothetical protein